MKLQSQEIWLAFDNKDPAYDGKFYVAVKSTGIFCRPSCTARKPLRKNVDFYDSAQECLEKGFRICKRCRPDLLFYRPTIELLERAKKTIERTYLQKEKCLEALKQLGVSENHLSSLFSKQYGKTPLQYRTQLCMQKAKELLQTTDKPVTEVVYLSGFASLPSFYRVFQKMYGCAPNEMRK